MEEIQFLHLSIELFSMVSKFLNVSKIKLGKVEALIVNHTRCTICRGAEFWTKIEPNFQPKLWMGFFGVFLKVGTNKVMPHVPK